MIRSGARSMIVAPLRYQDRVIGTIGLGSPHPRDLDATHLPKLHEVLPLFSMAVQRSMEELNARIQTQIKEKFTAIHPVVEWRGRQAGAHRPPPPPRRGGPPRFSARLSKGGAPPSPSPPPPPPPPPGACPPAH